MNDPSPAIAFGPLFGGYQPPGAGAGAGVVVAAASASAAEVL
jgi:anaerobic glycerol-3-phosphate dehydrogenase